MLTDYIFVNKELNLTAEEVATQIAHAPANESSERVVVLEATENQIRNIEKAWRGGYWIEENHKHVDPWTITVGWVLEVSENKRHLFKGFKLWEAPVIENWEQKLPYMPVYRDHATLLRAKGSK